MALILRRNEAERKKHGVKFLYYNTLFQFGMHATKGSTNFSISTNPSISSYTSSFFLSFCIFFLFFPRLRNRASTGLGQRQVTLYVLFFLVRTCLKLPSPGHAKHCRWHHFWTGLARLFRTTRRRNIEFLFDFLWIFLVSFLF